MKALLAFLLVALAQPAHAAFNPVDFFRGKTRGDGVLKIIFQSAKRMTVDSEGRTEKDGSLLLEQTIHEPGKPPRTRYWRLRETGPNRYEGSLTDAASAEAPIGPMPGIVASRMAMSLAWCVASIARSMMRTRSWAASA